MTCDAARGLAVAPADWWRRYRAAAAFYRLGCGFFVWPRGLLLKQDPRVARIRGAPLPHSHSALVATSSLPDLAGPRFASCRFLMLAGYEDLTAPLFALARQCKLK
jgi:hypothetical protein